MKAIAVLALLFLWVLHIGSLLGCAPAQETTTTTYITYTQYEVVDKYINNNAFGKSLLRWSVRINDDKVEIWKMTDRKELYYKYNVGDFFYEKRVHQHGIDSKELFPGKVPQ